MINAGAIFPSSISSCRRINAVGAFPMAKINGPGRDAALSILAAERVDPCCLAVFATSSSEIKLQAFPCRFSNVRLLMPDHAIFVSVTIVAPARSASFADSTACSEKVRVSAYSKSAVVWITRFMMCSLSAGNVIPFSSSSCPMISMLLFSISIGFTCSNSMVFSAAPFFSISNNVSFYYLSNVILQYIVVHCPLDTADSFHLNVFLSQYSMPSLAVIPRSNGCFIFRTSET